MQRIIETLFVIALFCGWYLVSYTSFSVCLSDDVEFAYGKKRVRNRRKKQRGFWTKFLFLDIRKEVIFWHYIMFWINLIASFIAIVALSVYVYLGNGSELAKICFIVFESVAFLTTAIISFVRYSLYAGNKVRSRKRYREQEAHNRKIQKSTREHRGRLMQKGHRQKNTEDD